jgi:UDP-3-O-[3-hydroxymyristoyl] glucosamine N-acyltransferase
MKLSELVIQLAIVPAATSLSSPNSHDPDLIGVAAIDQASPGMLSFVEGAPGAAHLDHTQASTLILPWDQELQSRASARGMAWIASDQPRYLFAQAIACFYQPWQLPPAQHPAAVLDPSVVVGKGVSIGAHAVIQAGVSLGKHVQIHPNVVIYPQVTIGDRTILHANCVIHERTVIGADCVIHSGAVIGAEGFGFVPMADHGWYAMPQSGRTVLEDQVVVGCNTTIDRPAVGETRIGKGTKIDNLVQIGHGSHLGEDNLLCAQVGLAGSTRLGKQVILAGQVGVSGQVELGDRTVVAAQSGVHQSLPVDAQVAGYPAINHRLWLRAMALVKQLPQLYQRLKALEREVGK